MLAQAPCWFQRTPDLVGIVATILLSTVVRGEPAQKHRTEPIVISLRREPGLADE